MEALKHTVRAALDVLMVGEIRDRAPGEAAVSAAGTGTLVLSTIHADSAAGAVARLLDMGIAPYLISETLRCTIAQRLVRRLCEHCRQPTELVPADLTDAGLPNPGSGALPAWRSSGCEVCGQTGYRGRVALFEVLQVDEEMKTLIRRKAPTDALNAHAVQIGMNNLASSALARIREGETSLDEVIRVLGMGN
jgi:type II secretory ATPase GspE/PulE/Tfp pilus assembly ATPase PilB-like protein